jgi:hypothetical protein
MNKTALNLFTAGLLLGGTVNALATIRYVDVNSANATPPYTNWATAATNIQDAVDAATAGDEIVVTNGIYAIGGRTLDGTTTNRVAVDKALALRSINGPQATIIDGGRSVRCVFLTNSTSLSGFTLTNGGAQLGGGLYCEPVNTVASNCIISGNSVFSSSGGPVGYPFPNQGGGVWGGRLDDCILSGNVAIDGGEGGGAYGSTLNHCSLAGNGADGGGGASRCALANCALTGNSSGGAFRSTLNNCTLTGNSGGGASYSTLTNCIVYFNRGSNYDPLCTLNYCCTTPLPANGIGNISSDPELASASHLSAFSPCLGKGSHAAASGTDIDGEPWANPPSMGCDEYHAGAVTGPLSAAITASFTNVAVGYSVDFTALIEGRTDLSVWEFGDGALEINQPYAAHSWALPGDYLVSLWAFSDSYPGGTSATAAVHVVGLHYVAANSTNPIAPYTSWTTAATNIQEAINAAPEPGAQVVVTNGTYAPITVFATIVGGGVGGLERPVSLLVRSVNGAPFTIIDGGHSNTCAFLGNVARLSGFTLTNGFAAGFGGGAYGGTLDNCTLSGNSALGTTNLGGISPPPPDGGGGGAAYSTLNNCVLNGNWAGSIGGAPSSGGGARDCVLNNCTLTANSTCCDGGGASGCTLNNCTLIGNSASNLGGGVLLCKLNNCIVYFNSAPNGANYDGSNFSTFDYCCTTPQPTGGAGNITNSPLFVDTNGWASLRLQVNSPCINAGNNAYSVGSTDLDGDPRIKGGTVDIGGYEFQAPTSIISYAWLQQYGLPTDGSADFTDPDGDGLNNWQEWVCGTNPTNALSALRLLTPVVAGTKVTLTWQSVAGVNYFLERTTNLTVTAFVPLAANLPGQTGATCFSDTNAVGTGPFFYRVGVGN